MKKLVGSLLVMALLCSAVFASGSHSNTVINALASDIVLTYPGNSKTAAADGITTASATVAAIHGLLETEATAPAQLTSLLEGTYNFGFSYLNRSNEDVNVDITRVFTADAQNHWTVTGDSGIKAIPEDTVTQWTMAVIGSQLESLETATLSVTAKIQGAGLNVVSYNAFAGAVGDMQGGAYGGVDAIFHSYTLVAQGVDLTILSRTAEVSTTGLVGYTGVAGAAVPGAKIKYTVVVRNNNAARVLNASIADVVPNSCHFFGTDAATVAGTESDAAVVKPTGTGAAGSPIVYSNMIIPGNATVTMSYTVTID